MAIRSMVKSKVAPPGIGPRPCAVSEVVGDGELVAIADAHHRHAFLPAPDQAAEREGRGLAARDGAVELGAVDEGADIVDGDGVGDGRVPARAVAADPALAQPADRAMPALGRIEPVEITGNANRHWPGSAPELASPAPARLRRTSMPAARQPFTAHFFPFFAGRWRPLPFFFAGPLAARSSISCAASSSVSCSGASDFGKVALVVPSVT